MLRVCDVMTSNVLTVDPGMSLREVVELFSTRHVSGAPVVAGGRVVGVISAADIVTAGAEAPRAAAAVGTGGEDDEWPDTSPWREENESPSEFYRATGSEGAALELQGDAWLDSLTVGELMTRSLCSLPPDASVVEAATYMLWANVHRILVIESDELLGILTTSDIVAAVAQRRL